MLSVQANRNIPTPKAPEPEVLSRRDFQEILLARMAGGDLYANELRLKFRRADQLMDVFRPKPLYPGTVHQPNASAGDTTTDCQSSPPCHSSPSCHSERSEESVNTH